MNSVENRYPDQNTLESPVVLFRKGWKAMMPLLIGMFPFSLITGSVAVAKGLTVAETFGFSVFIFAGASQLAALELIGENAPIWVVVLTAGMVNLRFMIYSASIAPYFKFLSKPWKMLCSYVLSDQAYVMSHNYYQKKPQLKQRHFYFLGAASALWVTWQLGCAVGVFIGAKVPPEWSLDFAVPLSFIALVVPNLKDKASLWAAMVAGVCVVILAPLPFNLGFIVAAFAGIAAGVLSERLVSA